MKMKIMEDWTLGRRLISGFIVTILVTVCLGALTWFAMRAVQQDLVEIRENDLPEARLAETMRYQLGRLRITNLKHVLSGDAAAKQELEQEAQREEAELAGLVAEYEHHIDSAEQRALFSPIPSLLDSYRAETRKLRDASVANKADETQAFRLSTGRIGNEFIRTVEVLRDLHDKRTGVDVKSVENKISSSRAMAVVISMGAVALGLVIAFGITRGICRILRRVAVEIHGGAAQTASASGQMAASSQSLAESASEQAASLEETSASLEQLSGMTRRNAENAHQATDLARQAREVAEKGAADMQALSTAMAAIKTSSDDVARIIKTIDEIALQTNILALNAAVEAARAGDAGMGFGVVADEVRNLAQRSAQAAKETAAKIEGAIRNTAQGVEITGHVAQGLTDIVTRTRQVDELTAEVATASREQSQGISQINSAVAQMDKVTQSNAATAQQSAAAAQELDGQAEVMKDSVAQLLRLVGERAAVSTQVPARMFPPGLPPGRDRFENQGPAGLDAEKAEVLIEWDEERMATGVESIDEQHQELIDMVNRLHRAHLAGTGKSELRQMMSFLKEYVHTHFQHEEHVMEQHQCPARAKNKMAHRQFTESFGKLAADFEAGADNIGVLLELRRLIADWLLNHVCAVDTALRHCVTARPRPRSSLPTVRH
jgi:methyl-accepting chemotaxis protein